MSEARKVDPSKVDRDTPLRLDVAAALAFPDNSMTMSSLRKERNAGRLETWMMAGKEFTSLAAIDEMVKQCRAQRRVPASTSSPPATTLPDGLLIARPGSSETESERFALEAALTRCLPPKPPSAPISSESTILPLRPARKLTTPR